MGFSSGPESMECSGVLYSVSLRYADNRVHVYRLAEKRRLRKLQFEETIGDYIEDRNNISASLDYLDKGRSRIVLYGAGDVAQILYTIVAHSKVELVGVVDDEKAGQQFFEHKIAQPSELNDSTLNSVPFDVIIVASYNHADDIKENLRRMNFPPSQVLVLFDRSNLLDPRYRLGHISPPSLVDPRELRDCDPLVVSDRREASSFTLIRHLH